MNDIQEKLAKLMGSKWDSLSSAQQYMLIETIHSKDEENAERLFNLLDNDLTEEQFNQLCMESIYSSDKTKRMLPFA